MMIVMSPVIAAVFVSGTLYIDGVSLDSILGRVFFTFISGMLTTPFHCFYSQQVDELRTYGFRDVRTVSIPLLVSNLFFTSLK